MFTTQGPKDVPEPRELSGAEINRTIRDHRLRGDGHHRWRGRSRVAIS
jgi:hypothetical protein